MLSCLIYTSLLETSFSDYRVKIVKILMLESLQTFLPLVYHRMHRIRMVQLSPIPHFHSAADFAKAKGGFRDKPLTISWRMDGQMLNY